VLGNNIQFTRLTIAEVGKICRIADDAYLLRAMHAGRHREMV
jgi:hypothetical protein